MAAHCARHPHTMLYKVLIGGTSYEQITALQLFYGRFSIDEVIGRTVIIHDYPDDFTTQPSENSGTKITCGVIRGVTGLCR